MQIVQRVPVKLGQTIVQVQVRFCLIRILLLGVHGGLFWLVGASWIVAVSYQLFHRLVHVERQPPKPGGNAPHVDVHRKFLFAQAQQRHTRRALHTQPCVEAPWLSGVEAPWLSGVEAP